MHNMSTTGTERVPTARGPMVRAGVQLGHPIRDADAQPEYLSANVGQPLDHFRVQTGTRSLAQRDRAVLAAAAAPTSSEDEEL